MAPMLLLLDRALPGENDLDALPCHARAFPGEADLPPAKRKDLRSSFVLVGMWKDMSQSSVSSSGASVSPLMSLRRTWR